MKMQNLNVMNKLSKVAGKSGLVLKKYSPEILLGAGIAGVVVSAIMACKATLKVEQVLDEHEGKVEKVNRTWERVQNGEIEPEKYTEKDKKKDLTVIYTQTGWEFIKLYGPAVSLGAASIACIIGAHGIIKKRNVALVAAYKALEEGFKEYRKRVIDEYGEDKDYMLRHGLTAETITETEIGEDGKPKKVKKEKLVTDGTNVSIYARFFDENCTEWSKDPEYNLMFLKAQQNWFNDMLKIRGHVFLNEVYDALGMPRSKAGAVVGWVLNEDGDNYIDFGIYDDVNHPRRRAFVNGNENAILLDFNVDGVIYDLI